MMNSVYILTTKMVGQRQELATTADNVANVNTHGFKRHLTDYNTLAPREGGHVVGYFAKPLAPRMDFQKGALETTGNPLDMALKGEGTMFAVDVNGTTEYTTNGRMLLNTEGVLINSEGYPVLDANNAPITLPTDAKTVSVATDGTISTEQGLVGQVGVFRFPQQELAQLVRTGGGRFAAGGGVALVAEPGEFEVVQGHLETSNVESVEEMVKLTELNRAYQSTLRASRSIEELDTRAIRSLAAMPN